MLRSRLQKSTFFLLLISLIIPIVALAQIGGSSPSMPKLGTIRGQLRLADGRTAPMGIAVYLEQYEGGGSAGQTQTDRSGKFEFSSIPVSVYQVIVRAPGYIVQPQQQQVDLMMSSQGYIEFTLRPDPNAMGQGGGPQPATGTISALDAKAPEDARKNVEDGQALLASGKDVGKSIDLFQKATKTYPEYVQAYLMMGIAYSSQQKWDDAEKPLRKAIELDKTSAPAYIALGSVQNEKKNFPEAESLLKKATELAPNSPDAHFELARTYWGLNNWDAADIELTKSIQLRPNHSGEHLLRGNVLLRKRDAAGALSEFQESVKLDPNGPLAEPTKQIIAKIQNALKTAKQ